MLTNLQYINLSRNNFNGTIPTELGQLHALGKLRNRRIAPFLLYRADIICYIFRQRTSFWRIIPFMVLCRRRFALYHHYIIWKNCMPIACLPTMNESFVTIRSHVFYVIAAPIVIKTMESAHRDLETILKRSFRHGIREK